MYEVNPVSKNFSMEEGLFLCDILPRILFFPCCYFWGRVWGRFTCTWRYVSV